YFSRPALHRILVARPPGTAGADRANGAVVKRATPQLEMARTKTGERSGAAPRAFWRTPGANSRSGISIRCRYARVSGDLRACVARRRGRARSGARSVKEKPVVQPDAATGTSCDARSRHGFLLFQQHRSGGAGRVRERRGTRRD